MIGGSPFGGITYNFGGIRLPFLLIAGFLIVDAICRAVLLASSMEVSSPSSESEVNFGVKGWMEILGDSQIVIIAILLLLTNMVISMMEVLFPLYLSSTYNLSPAVIGIIFGSGLQNLFYFSIS